MIIDKLGVLREATAAVTGTEAGHNSTVRDGSTGRAVIPVDSTGYCGLPIVVITSDDSGTSSDKTLTVTIEASDAEAFGSGVETVATFPAVKHGDKGTLMVRRIHTGKKYIRSVITGAGSDGTIGVNFLIFVSHGYMPVK